MADSLTPEQASSGPLYARESDEPPAVGTERRPGVSSGPQAGAESLDGLRSRLDAEIRPVMLLGLQDAELFDEPGRERINDWVDWLLNTVTKVLTAPADDTSVPDAAPDTGLRERYAAALEAADYSGDMRRGDLADTVMRVRDREMEQLRADLARWRAGHEAAEAQLVHERREIERLKRRLGLADEVHQQNIAELQRLEDAGQPVIDAKERAEAKLRRAELLRDKWLAHPAGDMHHAAGLMLASHLTGEAFNSNADDQQEKPHNRPAAQKES